jgi:hypothetical protein
MQTRVPRCPDCGGEGWMKAMTMEYPVKDDAEFS